MRKIEFRDDVTDDFEDTFQLKCFHTNFKITKSDMYMLENIDGIETLIPVSQYRTYYSVGELFDEAEVEEEIELSLTDSYNYELINSIHDKDLREEVKKTRKEMTSFKYWSISVLPNGKVHSFGEDCPDSFESHGAVREEILKCNGLILESQNGNELYGE